MRKSICILIAVVILASGAVFFVGCSKKGDKGGPGKAAAAQGSPSDARGGEKGKSAKLVTAVADFKPMTQQREYIGEVQPAFSVDMRSNGSGWLKSISVDIGRKVTKGQPLCVVDQQDMQAQRESIQAQGQQAMALNQSAQAQGQQTQAQNQQAQAAISAAEAAVARAEADLDQAKSDETRTEALFQKGYVSQADLENAKTAIKRFQAALNATNAQLQQTKAGFSQSKAQMQQSQAQISASQAQMSQYKAQLKSMDVRLNDMTIRSPFTGVVAERYVDAGAYVSPSTSILKIVDDSSVKVVINATEDDITRVSIGAPAAIKVDSWPNRQFDGKVIRIAPVVDSVSRTGAVEIQISNESRALKGGMMARVSLVAAQNPSALAIPVAAVQIDQVTGGKFVMVMEGKNLHRVDVETGIQSGDYVEITKGLAAGDKVVVSGLSPDAGNNGNGGADQAKPQGKAGGK